MVVEYHSRLDDINIPYISIRQVTPYERRAPIHTVIHYEPSRPRSLHQINPR